MGTARVLRFGTTKRLVIVAVLVASALASAAAPGARAASRTISFAGEGRIYEFGGTFTLDHFAVKTPVNPAPDWTQQPHLVAVGTVSGDVLTPFGSVSLVFTNEPFVWVNVTVSATCRGNVVVTFNPLLGTDFTNFFAPSGDSSVWGPSVPFAPWDSSVHWGMTSAGSTTLDSNLACAVARTQDHAALEALAATLNAALRG